MRLRVARRSQRGPDDTSTTRRRHVDDRDFGDGESV